MMRIEDRIEEIACYRTEDGKIFNSYEDARKHIVEEEVEDISAYDLQAFTDDGKQVFPVDIDSQMDAVYYFSIRTEKALEFMKQIFQDYGYNYSLEKLGDYRYDEDFEEWRNKENDYRELNEKWKILNEMT